ncbi:hypothetical protein Hypma_000695 [Hypsizygus marmoreus]|uniref:CBM1 domain-containing protein n=1 Tax=Hypsizygus marmoreus TaxID=39966 RepID=A0A369J7H7_HYPMA|nr:hypothetical protein Hypma_000695 [Hypsizygus marmoreus]
MVALTWAVLSAFTLAVRAGTTLWSGSFNPFTTAADFDKWSWSNQVGPYQWYIHGSQPTSRYLALSPSYKNPAHATENNGLKLSIDSTSTWNSQFERSELIPQTTANLGSGNLFYHFSVKRSATNAPDVSLIFASRDGSADIRGSKSTLEHQVCFFESHFTELKYGVGSNPTNLVWMVSGVEKWSTPFTPDAWFNFAYDINFSAGTVGLWASTGSSPLTKVVQNIAASTSTNSADWHLGVLRLVNGPGTEDWYFSGVFVENGPITTTIGSGTGGGTTTPPTSSSSTTTPTTPTTTTTATGPTQTQWGQCGGNGYTGPTVCASPYTCVAVSPPYYSQASVLPHDSLFLEAERNQPQCQ